MKKITTLAVCVSTLAMLASGASFADNRAGATTLQLGEGYYYFAQKRNVQNTDIPNLALQYSFNDHWAAEISAGVFNSTEKGAAVHDVGVHGWVYSLDGIYRFTPYGRLAPYLLAGPGVFSLKPAGNDPVDQAFINVGVGTQYFIDDSIAFFGEAKDLYTISGGKNDGMLNAGITFLFGGTTPQVSAAPYKGEK